MTVSLSALRAARAKMTPLSSENREPEPCADGVHLHSYDGWPAGSVTAADRKVDQCEWCGWTEVERDERAAGIVATHNAADVLIEIAEAALALREAEREAERMRFELDCHKGRGIPDSVLIQAANTEVRLDVCRNAYDAAIAKVTP